MKRFFAILVTVAVCCSSAFAVPLRIKQEQEQREQQESKRKMSQLKQLLTRAMQGDGPSNVSGGNISQPQNDVSSAKQQAVAKVAPSSAPAPASASALAAPTPSLAAPTNNNVAQKQNSVYDEAFSNVVNQMLPMSPEQIAKLKEVFIESQLSAAIPPGTPSKPTSSSIVIDLSPQATPPVIRLGAGYITSLVFLDATGQPWPIAAYSIGDPGSFNIQWDNKGNTLLIQSATFYKRSNLAVMLRDLNTPLMITLISGQEAIDYRVDLRVPGLGPNAVFMQSGIPESSDPVLLDVLNGIAPKGSKELKVVGGECQAWLRQSKLYLRTKLKVISPGWHSIMSSIDGTHAYQMPATPIILALQNGRDKTVNLMLEGLE